MTAENDRAGPRLRGAAGVTAFLALTALTVPFAYAGMFSLFQPYDDEGYLLVSLDGFLSGEPLYDQVYSQYGPFTYVATGALFRLFQLEVTHDTGRLFTLVLWLGAAFLGGLAVYRLTRSLVMGLGSQLLFTAAISTVTNEPMHPGALLGVLLMGMLTVVAFLLPHRTGLALSLIGVLAGAMALVKVNVGTFAIASVALTCVVTFPFLARRRLVVIAAGAAFVAIPLLVMLRDLDQGWALRYSLLVAMAGLALVLVTLRREPDPRLQVSHLLWLLGGAGLVVATVSAVVLASGTSVSALFQGALLDPLRQPEAFALPFVTPDWTFVPAALGVLAAGVLAWRGRAVGLHERAAMVPGILRIVAGLMIWYSVATVGRVSGSPLLLALPLAWLAAVPPGGRGSRGGFGRVFVPALAILQALHAYPVAASQTSWAGMLLIPVGAVCMADGTAALAAFGRARGRPPGPLAWRAVPVAAVLLFLAWVLATIIGPAAGAAVRTYGAGTPLLLPGAERVRLSPESVQTYRSLSKALGNRCGTFVSIPGTNSLYLFSGIPPPTYLNATAWMFLFDDATQLRVVGAVERLPEVCAVRNQGLLAYWSQGRAVPRGPLVSYIERSFGPAKTIEGFELLVRTEGVP
jgi:hypothetical protein